MYKYFFIILLFNGLFTQKFVDDFSSHRTRYDFGSSRNLILDTSSYRNEEQLLQFIETIVQTHSIPGLSISILKENNIIWERYFGFANINENIFVDQNTMFILSSVSKTITVTALMQLFEENLFLLDDDIDDYLPFNVNHPENPFIPITFKMLLSHTSGIRDNWNVMPYYDGDSPLDLNYYLSQYFSPGGQFYNGSLNFTNSIPGLEYSYSNLGVALIGLLVEQITNQSFSEYCYENIFEPLEMNNTFWFLSEIPEINQVALPYQLIGGSGDTCFEIGCGVYDASNTCFCDFACLAYNDCCPDYEDVCGEGGTGSSYSNLISYEHYGYSDYPSGQLRTTSNDLAKFMGSYINDGIYNEVRILESETIELIKTIHYPLINSQQGLIWYYKNSGGRTLFGHNGGDIGSSTEMFISFPNNLGVVLLSNSNNYDAIIQIENALFEFAEYLDSIMLGDINSDNFINVQDIIIVVNLILNAQFDLIADMNSDSTINVLDIIQLVNIILNN